MVLNRILKQFKDSLGWVWQLIFLLQEILEIILSPTYSLSDNYKLDLSQETQIKVLSQMLHLRWWWEFAFKNFAIWQSAHHSAHVHMQHKCFLVFPEKVVTRRFTASTTQAHERHMLRTNAYTTQWLTTSMEWLFPGRPKKSCLQNAVGALKSQPKMITLGPISSKDIT